MFKDYPDINTITHPAIALDAIKRCKPYPDKYLFNACMLLAEQRIFLDQIIPIKQLRQDLIQNYETQIKKLYSENDHLMIIDTGLEIEAQKDLLRRQPLKPSLPPRKTLQRIRRRRPQINSMIKQMLGLIDRQTPLGLRYYWQEYKPLFLASKTEIAQAILTHRFPHIGQECPSVSEITTFVVSALQGKTRMDKLLAESEFKDLPNLRHLLFAQLPLSQSCPPADGSALKRSLDQIWHAHTHYLTSLQEIMSALLYSRASQVEDLISHREIATRLQRIYLKEAASYLQTALTADYGWQTTMFARFAWEYALISDMSPERLQKMLSLVVYLCKQGRRKDINKTNLHSSPGDTLFRCFRAGTAPPPDLYTRQTATSKIKRKAAA